MTFKVGDKVFWESQAAGTSRRKEGEVIEVVPKKAKPKTKLPAEPGTSRDHESYVVRAHAVGTITEKYRKYWPIASKLQALVPAVEVIQSLEAPSLEDQVNATVEEIFAKDPLAPVAVELMARELDQTGLTAAMVLEGVTGEQLDWFGQAVKTGRELEVGSPVLANGDLQSASYMVTRTNPATPGVEHTEMTYVIRDENSMEMRYVTKEEYEAFIEKDKEK